MLANATWTRDQLLQAFWFATEGASQHFDEILPVGVKYAFMDPVTKPFSYVSFAFRLLYQCIDTLYFSGKLE